ncbi:MAG: hypothetical protein M1436_03495 [Acidobacteria bacterium]|nr:hypothetical protein [Acidobacteriota bacterium]
MKKLAIAFALVSVASAQRYWISAPPQVTANEFPIVAWNPSPSDPQQLQWMREAGLNVSGFCRVEDLDKVAAAGLSCLVADKRANGYDWRKLPDQETLRQNVQSLARDVEGKPAVFGFQLRDEPGAQLMPGLGKVAALLREAAPGKFAYVNLFPTYASPQQLGSPSYEAHVRTYLADVHPQFLSWDNYSLIEGEMQDRFFTNMEIIRRMALEAGIPFWNCILANSHFHYMEPSDATFNLQVFSTLAYGGRGIQYFTYFTPSAGNYRLGAVDQFGNRTTTWEKLRLINNKIHTLAPVLLKLKSTGVYHSPEPPAEGHGLAESRLVESVTMRPPSKDAAPARCLIGEFQDGQGRPYLMLVNKSLSQSYSFEIHRSDKSKKLIYISPYSGQEQPFGGELDWIAPGAGVLFRIG